MKPSQIETSLKKAIALHQMDKLQKAEVIYKKILKIDPQNESALHFYGLLHFNRGQVAEAIEYMLAAIGLNPGYVDVYVNLGNIYLKTARLSDAKKCYEKALELNPNHLGAASNIGVLLRYQSLFDESIQHLTAITQSNPDWGQGYLNLANTFKVTAQHEKALANYTKAVELDPRLEEAYHGIISSSQLLDRPEIANQAIESLRRIENKSPTISHMLAAYSGENTPLRASDEYIQSAFDAYADSFESSLASLGYCAPALLEEALKDQFPQAPANLRILDAGCGTGLASAQLKPYARKLIGMDLSQKMLDRARQKNAYDQLVCASLEEGVAQFQDYFDLVASLDTLIYFGDLNLILRVIRDALKDGGHLIFTLEASAQPEGYELCQTGRYTHTLTYVAKILESLTFTVDTLRSCVVRKELGQDVQGWLVVARKTL